MDSGTTNATVYILQVKRERYKLTEEKKEIDRRRDKTSGKLRRAFPPRRASGL